MSVPSGLVAVIRRGRSAADVAAHADPCAWVPIRPRVAASPTRSMRSRTARATQDVVSGYAPTSAGSNPTGRVTLPHGYPRSVDLSTSAAEATSSRRRVSLGLVLAVVAANLLIGFALHSRCA